MVEVEHFIQIYFNKIIARETEINLIFLCSKNNKKGIHLCSSYTIILFNNKSVH